MLETEPPAPVEQASTQPNTIEALFHQSCPDNKLSFGQYLEIKTAFEAAGLGTITYLTEHDEAIPPELKSQITTKGRFHDIEGNQSAFNISIPTKDPHPVLVLAKQLGILAGLIGAGTSGTNNFGSPKINYGTPAILAIENPRLYNLSGKDQNSVTRIDPKEETPASWYPKHGEYRLSADGKSIFAGRGISTKLVSFLAEGRQVPEDHTTLDSDDHVASYMAGAHGPRRIRPHNYIKRVIASDGENIIEISGADIEKYEGTLGLHLSILAIEYHTFEVPKNSFVFITPLNITDEDPSTEEGNWAREQGEVNGHLEFSFARADRETKKLKSSWPGGILNGAEIVTAHDRDNGQAYGPTPEKTRAAEMFKQQMAGKDNQADSVYALYITGNCEEDPQYLLIDAIVKYGAYKEFGYTAAEFEAEEPEPGRHLEYPSDHNPFEILVYLAVTGKIRTPKLLTTLKELAGCEALREALPSAAKNKVNQAKQTPGLIAESKSTDSNTGIAPARWKELEAMNPADAASQLITLNREQLQSTLNFDIALHQIETELHTLQGTNPLAQRIEFSVNHYGHRNDPHERYTVIGDTRELAPEEAAEVTKLTKYFATKAKKATEALITEQLELPRQNPSLVVERGEKGRLPHYQLLSAEERAQLENEFTEDPHNTARFLGWRILGTPQEAIFASRSAAIQALKAAA